MKRTLKSVILILACLNLVSAQQAESRTATNAKGDASASANKNVAIESGTQISGELQKALDVKRAKVGDPVVLKTTKAIKSEGRKVVSKGAKLVGHVTEVTRKTDANPASSISILFDSVQDGSLAVPITATISSLTASRTNAATGEENSFRSDSDMRSASNISAAPAGGGGLIGGVTGTVGGAVNNSASTLGSVVGSTTAATSSAVNATGNVVGASTRAVSGSLGRIQISESSNTSVEGGSALSLTGENLRLEKGTTFNLVISQSASAGASRQP